MKYLTVTAVHLHCYQMALQKHKDFFLGGFITKIQYIQFYTGNKRACKAILIEK